MSYGELILPLEYKGRNLKTGRFMKGNVPANKGKKWDEYMGKRAQRRAKKGWKNLDKYRNKNGRADNAGRCRKVVIAVMDDGKWNVFPYLGAAAKWVGGTRENVGRCCRDNQSKRKLSRPWGIRSGHKPEAVNTDHRYKGVRFYFESDNTWMEKINQNT